MGFLVLALSPWYNDNTLIYSLSHIHMHYKVLNVTKLIELIAFWLPPHQAIYCLYLAH